MSESIPLEQGLRLEVFLLPVAQRCQRAFHQNKDLQLFEENEYTPPTTTSREKYKEKR